MIPHKLKPTQAGAPFLSGLLSPLTAPVVAPMAPAAPLAGGRVPSGGDADGAALRGSARRKLWDMGHSAACPIAGVCLRFPDLYKLARKVGLSVAGCSEYEVHILVVSECRRRSDMAERVQRDLDARYELYLKKAQRFKTPEELARWWDQACAGTDWAGVFWVVLTHPRCTPELEFIVLGQVHMLQHQVGMAARADHTRLKDVLDENLRLGEELELVQHRLQAAQQAHTQQLARLQAELVQLRGDVIRAQTERDQAQRQWAQLKAQAPDLPARQALADENSHLLAHNRQLRRALTQAEQALARATVAPAAVPPDAAGGADAAEGRDALGATGPLQLADRAVLCVGGRTGGIPIYREVIEHKGGRFLHHDGGEEERAAQLGSHLQAADVVICQVGCISHNAYWRVKEHCKRTGKPCLFVESASRSALERALGQVAVPAGSLPEA